MFQNLRQGSQVYLLHKGMSPYLEVGTVESLPGTQMMGYYPNLPMLPLDITVRIGERVVPYKQLPPNAEVANVINPQNGEEVCVACSKDSVNVEIQQMMQKSVEIINSIESHKQRIETCKNLLNQLNPEMVREAKQAHEINDLKAQLADMKRLLEDLKPSSPKENNYEHDRNQDAAASDGRNGRVH